jgi:V8-like Glu-specific endopeptidase
MKKVLLFLYFFIGFTFVNAEPEVKHFLVQENGIEIKILYPNKIRKGDRIVLMGIMKNKYMYARMGGLTLSFPQFKYTKGTYTNNTFDTISSYSPPDKIYSGIVKKNISSKYYMIEGWENKWRKWQSKQFLVELEVPLDIDHLIIDIRGILVVGKAKSNSREITIPKKSRKKDQQGYAVNQLIIPIEKKNVYNQPIKNPVKKSPVKQVTTGTGFFIDTDILITNHHVVEKCNKIEVIRNGYNAEAKIKSLDIINDLAVLKATKSNQNFLKFRSGKGIRVGETIIAMGYPLGNLLGTNIKLTLGNISSLTGLVNDSTKLQLTAPVQQGNSGGPLLDNYGNIVGVIYAGLKNHVAQNVNLAIKSSVAKMFLDANDVNYNLDTNSSKKEVVDIAEDAKKSIVQVICR